MRIAQCSDSFLPVVDGVSRVVYQYAQALSLSGNECTVITPLQNSGYRGHHPFEIVDYLSLKIASVPQYPTGIATLDSHYMEHVSYLEPELIHVHAPGLSGLEGLRLADKHNVPAIGTFHSKYYDDFLRVTHSDILATLGSRYVADFYKRCDEVWTVSEDAVETLHSYGYKDEIVIVQNGTDVRDPSPEYENAARAAFQLSEEPILLFVGQIDYKKNLCRILEAAKLLKDHGRSFQLVFVGQGQDREKLEAFAIEIGLEKVLFTGYVGEQDLLDGLYMAASLFVFPSLYDTAGLVVREAAVMGTPSVVVQNTAPAEIITDGVNGLVCSDNAESLCSVMEHYLFEMSDAGRAAMRKNTRESIPLPWEKVMPEVEERYRALIARGRQKKKFGLFSSEPAESPVSPEKSDPAPEDGG